MHMIGTLLFLIIWIMAEIPPRSPELMPSTSSIIIKDFWRFFAMSRLKEDDSINPTPLLFLMSLALNSETWKLSSIAIKRAADVLPMPGSPLSRAAFELMDPLDHPLCYLTYLLLPLKWISSQASNHYRSCLIWDVYPTTSSSVLGRYFSVQREVSSLNLILTGAYFLTGRSFLIGSSFCSYLRKPLI